MDPETRGERAAAVLADETYQGAVLAARQRIKDQWARESSAEARERLWHKLQAIEAVNAELTVIRDNGLKARHDRKREEQRA